MAELLALTAAIAFPPRTSYRVSRLILDWDAKCIQAYVKGSDGVEVLCEWTSDIAVSLMTTLNTANLSTSSLHKRVLTKCLADGKLPAGTISGTPA